MGYRIIKMTNPAISGPTRDILKSGWPNTWEAISTCKQWHDGLFFGLPCMGGPPIEPPAGKINIGLLHWAHLHRRTRQFVRSARNYVLYLYTNIVLWWIVRFGGYGDDRGWAINHGNLILWLIDESPYEKAAVMKYLYFAPETCRGNLR